MSRESDDEYDSADDSVPVTAASNVSAKYRKHFKVKYEEDVLPILADGYLQVT